MLDPDKIPPELWKKMNITREEFEKVSARAAAREEHVPEIGALAPEFELERLSQSGDLTGESVRLSDFRGRPVALVFGSYT